MFMFALMMFSADILFDIIDDRVVVVFKKQGVFSHRQTDRYYHRSVPRSIAFLLQLQRK